MKDSTAWKRLQGPVRYLWAMLRRTFAAWNAHNGPRMGAALAYYGLFSLAPLLHIAVAVAGAFIGDFSARDAVVKQVQTYVGPQGARAIQGLLEHMPAWESVWGSAIGSAAILLVGATALLSELQASLNEIWNAEPPPRAWLAFIRRRAVALGFVLGFGLLLLLVLALGAAVAALGEYLSSRMPLPAATLYALDSIVSFGAITLFLAMIYKYLPDTRIAWGDVWTGAGVTALLFTLGNLLLSAYLGKSDLATAFGAAGSLALIVVWVFYCAQILYFGAEFTYVYAHRQGSRAPSRRGR